MTPAQQSTRATAHTQQQPQPKEHSMKPTDPGELISNLNAGVFAQQVGTALSVVSGAVVDHGKAGKVTITFDIKQIDGSHQVSIDHKLSYTEPTKRGKRTEETATKTPMYVTAEGLQLFQPSPTPDMFGKNETTDTART